MRFPLALLFSVVLLQLDAYKILVYIPKFAISHINYMGKIADTLVAAGHNVTALISEMDAKLTDGTRNATQIIRISPAEGADHMNTFFMKGDFDMFEAQADDYWGAMDNSYHNSVSFCLQCRRLLTTPGLVERLKEEQYDALITENFDLCAVGLSALIKPRALIPVSSTFIINPSDFGLHWSIFTDPWATADAQYNNDLYSRFMQLYYKFMWFNFLRTQNTPLQAIFDELYPGIPPFAEILGDAAVVFPNSEPLIDVARPSISKVVPIGGITVGQPKPLDDYWSALLSLRPRTVLISFGSIAKSVLMKQERKDAMLEAFASFPDTTFIWKYENTSDFFSTYQVARVPNVVLTTWAPQLDLLADRRLSLFITHAGMASCHELSTFGVPSLLVPIFGDQIHNAAALARVGMAEIFDKFDMKSAAKVKAVIGRMLSDPSYPLAAARLREQLAARPDTPAQRLVKHVEFAARFGPSKALRPLNLNLNWAQFYGLDIVAGLIFALAILIFSVITTVRILKFIVTSVKIRKAQKID